MINSSTLLSELKKQVTALENDIRSRCDSYPEVDAPLKEAYDLAKGEKRTAFTYAAWRDDEITQISVAWVLACVFVRFLEDNELVPVPKIAGPGEKLRRAKDEHEHYFRSHPTATDRDYLHAVFTEFGELPAMKEFFDQRHNPLWKAGPSGDACRALWSFWQQVDATSGELLFDFTDPDWNTRFLGDLYQDLSEAARKKYALLQTPDFVEEFILDRTLTPAIDTFGYRETRMIDPTCGSGHFLLGGFERLFRIWENENPGENPRVLAQHALDAVNGVDLNPFAVAIARFRLLLAALKVCGITQLKNAPDFRINLAVGDSLIHGARFDKEGNAEVIARQDMFGGEEVFKDETAHFFDTEDSQALHHILGRQYHAVVGNPPYIQSKDRALNQLYRNRYKSCAGKYALSVPFMERIFDLALAGSKENRQPAGFTGQITSNSFMKRSFGKKLIENYIRKWDISHVIDASGAYIPGHGTPTVILFGRNIKPQASVVRTIMGIKGEPATPENPSKGKVWTSIISQVDNPGSESEYVSAANTEREKFYDHPWNIGGGGAAELSEKIASVAKNTLENLITRGAIGAVTGEDDAFTLGGEINRFTNTDIPLRKLIEGDLIRDWGEPGGENILFPYDSEIQPSFEPTSLSILSNFKTNLNNRIWFRKPHHERGLNWWEYAFLSDSIAASSRLITFAFVATHNHFVLDRGGKVFKQTAPVIKLPADATEDDHLHLLGLLNSSTACFWTHSVCQGKHIDKPGFQRFEYDGTKLKQFPVTADSPLALSRELDRLAQDLTAQAPDTLADRDAVSDSALTEAEQTSDDFRARMISLQEELDWQCYRHYGLIEANDQLEWPEERLADLPPITLGQRAFEIRMARQVEAGELETTWFERHADSGSKAITELPDHWPDDYRALVERRLAFIEENKNINLIERPEYKRRWNTEPWAKRQKEALRKWLLARLEGYFFEGSRVCDLKDTFDPATKGFAAASQPQFTTIHQLADVVSHDAKWMEAAEVYHGSAGFDVATLVKKLVEPECVPFLPIHRYKPSGLRKREDWEKTWDLQRQEDAVEAQVRADHPELDEESLKTKIRSAQQDQVGDIPVPPKYASKDFLKASFWKMRGKLDVPKERWISYPGCELDNDESLVIAWAGWDHAQQAQALGAYYFDAKDNQAWPVPRLRHLLAGLSDLISWLKQWHNDYNPAYGGGLGDYYAGLIDTESHNLSTTTEALNKLRFESRE